MEYCSYELSVQLRDAGFPQPSLAVGQVWWIENESSAFWLRICFIEGDVVGFHLFGGGSPCTVDLLEFNGVYAPTALDILKELTGQYPPIVYYSKEAGLWSCLDRDPGNLLDRELGLPPIGFADKSAVIAIAKFWLYKNKKTQRVSVVEAAKALQDSIDNLTKS